MSRLVSLVCLGFSPTGIALLQIDSTVSTPATIPNLPNDVVQGVIKQHLPVAWRFDEDGCGIPHINADALDILQHISEEKR